ncbi:MAG: M28 family peptidase, partial [Anaerovorax sp.]
YAYNIALQLSQNEAFRSSSLGSRTAGSDAEHAAADYLYNEMKKLGLTDVEKVGVNVDKWQFNDATLTVNGIDKVIKPHSYATAATPTQGIEAEIIYVNQGTMQDYEGIDATGKILLIDIDQRANWWITYPMLEAQLKGAAAIMSSNNGGFAQLNKDTLNAQDICGPTGIPTVSISVNDADLIKNALKKGPVTGNLMVDNIVEPGGTSYNIMGKIEGKGESDQFIAIGGHYDMYFNGFQDDSCAVGLTLAMAKAMIDSGYQPDNDIVFLIHGAEEWGASYTQFDWTTGAWRMIYEAHPEWAGKLLTFINFELPAYEFASYTSMYSAPELYSSIDYFVNKSGFAPKPDGCFPDGVKTAGYQTYTYSDDFSYYTAGVPSTVNGFLLQEDMETPFDFYIERYHSQFDDSSTYNEKVMDFNIKLYGSFAIYTDKTPALPLNFTSQYDRLSASLNEEICKAAGADVEAYKAALEKLKVACEENYQGTVDFNNSYVSAKNLDATEEELVAMRQEGDAMNQKSLATFKYVQDQLLGLMYERPIVPHEAPQENIDLINSTVDCLNKGDVVKAADDYAWMVNNVLEWYAMYFSPEVIAIQNDMLYGEKNKDNLFWGTHKMFTPANVEEATRMVMANYDTDKPDLTKAISIYEKAVVDQQTLLKKLMAQETTAMNALTKKLNGK